MNVETLAAVIDSMLKANIAKDTVVAKDAVFALDAFQCPRWDYDPHRRQFFR